MNKVIFDLDDFAPDRKRNAMDWLFYFKSKYPTFKVTLFTILGLCNPSFIKDTINLDWIKLAAHGFKHTKKECLLWKKEDWNEVLDLYEKTGPFTKIFKAPEWEMTKLGYQILRKNGWAVAVRESQIDSLPSGMFYYSFEANPKGVHGHTWLLGAHKAEGMFDDWSIYTCFEFIKDDVNLEIKK